MMTVYYTAAVLQPVRERNENLFFFCLQCTHCKLYKSFGKVYQVNEKKGDESLPHVCDL